MLPYEAIDWMREALGVLLAVSVPLLATALVIGLATALAQALTQVTDPTLSLVPKVIGVMLVAIVALPWMLTMLLDFARRMYSLP
ncbi:MAG: flagellar biosynthetic protein FliQ [Phycisphaerae bacterium]|nr:flagellar biosynthetic protein FliQ [Phycisphaerae bacterium]